MRVVIAPDSFKGSLSGTAVAARIAAGWRRLRPGDEVLQIAQADGGEGTAEVLAAARPGAEPVTVAQVTGPDGRPVTGGWVRLDHDTALVELAINSGLPLLAEPAPMSAHTLGVGQAIADALDAGVRRIVVGLGGSASTDGGAAMLVALGLGMVDADGRDLPLGGAALARLARVDTTDLRRPDEVLGLTDVRSPLLGPEGAAAVFGPQKGADAGQVAELDAALAHWAAHWDTDPQQPGMGAAGGTGHGLVAGLGARLVPGAPWVSAATGLDEAVVGADVLITGEGRLDATSLTGKVVSHVLGLGSGVPRRVVVCGSHDGRTRPPGVEVLCTTELAGSAEASLADPEHWLAAAGEELAGLA